LISTSNFILDGQAMKLILTVTRYNNRPPAQPLSKIFDQMGGTIGRASNNDMVLADPAKCLSRKHAEVRYQRGNYYLVDAGGKNPIYINNRHLGAGGTARLADGDIIGICDYTLAVSLPSLEEPTGVSNSFDVLNVQSPPPRPLPPGEGELYEDVLRQGTGPLTGGSNEARLDEGDPDYRDSRGDEIPLVMEPMPSVRVVPEKIPEGYDPMIDNDLSSNYVSESSSPDHLPGNRIPRTSKDLMAATEARTWRVSGRTPTAERDTRGEKEFELLRAFLKGVGMPDLPVPAETIPDFMVTVGKMLREFVRGSIEVLKARAVVKNEMRAERTILEGEGNNPLKFCPGVDYALQQLLAPTGGGFLPPLTAIREAFSDLKAHELAVMVGLLAALKAVLDGIDPQALEDSQPRSRLAILRPAKRQANLWERWVELYRQIRTEDDDDFYRLFRSEFIRAYEEQVHRLQAQKNKREESP
jgi:type VI secretion system FHA domain protein